MAFMLLLYYMIGIWILLKFDEHKREKINLLVRLESQGVAFD